MDRTSVAGICVLGVCLAGGAATDGYYWPNGWYHHLNPWESVRYWERDCVPGDGGVAYFTGTQAGNIVFTTDVALGGLDFGQVQLYTWNGADYPTVRANGGSLTLTGDRAFVNAEGVWNGDPCGPVFRLPLRGTGANTFTKHGGARILLEQPATGFATVAVGGGTLAVTNRGETLFAAEGTLAVRGGTAQWTPAGDGAAEAALPPLAYGPQGGALAWTAPAGGSATLTTPALAREGTGATLELAPSGGTAALGETERLKAATPPEAAANGMLDAGLVVRDRTQPSAPISFLAYDAEKGVVPYPSAKAWDAAGEGDVAVLSETNTLTASRKIHALVLDRSATLEITAGATLAVGDGVHPAGVVFNRQVPLGKDAPLVFEGAGTLDFGSSPGVLWASSPQEDGWGANRAVRLKTAITGTAGVTFAARPHEREGKTGFFYLHPGFCRWTGPTTVSGTMLWLQDNKGWQQDGVNFPTGDLYVEGGSGGNGASLRLSYPLTFPQNVFVAGRGMAARGNSGGDGGGAFYFTGGSDGTAFTKPVTLTDNAWFQSDAGVGVHFRDGVKGPGDLHVQGGTFHFYETNTYGRLVVEGAATTLAFHTNATFGAGGVLVSDQATLNLSFTDVAGAVLTNAFRLEKGARLNLALNHASPTFDADVSFATAAFANFSTLKAGGRLALGAVTAAGARDAQIGADGVEASADGAEVVVGGEADGTFALPLADGAGTLAFTKTGAGTLELGRAARTYSGATTVAAGTLRLVDDPRFSRSLAYWFDASREEDVEKDAQGVVTRWKARGGSSGITALTVTAGAPTWGTAEPVNGRAVVSTRAGGGTADQLVAEGKTSCAHRTVFVVARARANVVMGGLIGGFGTDIGQRMDTGSGTGWDCGSGDWTLETRGLNDRLRVDGADRQWPKVDPGTPHLLTLFHDRDGWPAPKGWNANMKTAGATLVPALGWYQSKGRNFDGDYCEILCFDRILDEAETRLVENALAEKWLGKTLHADIDRAGHLPAGTALRVEAGATLDLNGCPLVVASLAGSGTITNSAATPATLSVTGGASFTGVVGGAVTLQVAGNADVGARFGAGTTLAVAGGGVTAGAHILAPPTNGLAYWCDAGRDETVLRDAAGSVTGWLSRAASSAKGLFNPGNLGRARPAYEAMALGGRPGVVFPAANEAGDRSTAALRADAASPVQTVLLALVATKTVNCAGYWGTFGVDRGFRAGGGAATVEHVRGGVRYGGMGDYVSLDGAVRRDEELSLGAGAVRILATRLDPANHADLAAFLRDRGVDRFPTALGAYCANGAFVGAVGEVIAYDRALTDDEMARAERYLVAKWKAAAWSEGQPPAETEDGFAPGAALRIEGAQGCALAGNVALDGPLVIDAQGATSLTPIVVAGDLALGAGARVEVKNYRNLPRGTRQTALRVTGTATGDFAAVAGLESPWAWRRAGNDWFLIYASGTVLLFR